MPGAPGGTQIEPPTNYLTPAIFSIAALYNPAAISLSWLTNEILACAQKVATQQALKLQGLDVKVIEEKNEEIRKKMMEMMPKNFASGPFPVMNVNFDSKTGQFKIDPMNSEKNEVQKNFMEKINGEEKSTDLNSSEVSPE